MLWNDVPTEVAIQETFDLNIWPVTNVLNSGPINFNIPSQPHGLMTDVHIITKLKIQKDGMDIDAPQKSISVVNNFANSLWAQVEIQVDDRLLITQSMKNSYAYQTFFNHALNSESNRSDYLFYNELFKMDQGRTKALEEESRECWVWNDKINEEIKGMMTEDVTDKDDALETVKEKLWLVDLYNFDTLDDVSKALGFTGDEIKSKHMDIIEFIDRAWVPANNPSASDRSRRILRGQSLTLSSKLQCPLFNTRKCLPNNMRIRVSLTKNEDSFILLANEEDNFSVFVEDCYLNVTYYRPRDAILNLMEERLQHEAAPYFITRPELIIKPISNAGQIIRVTDVFQDVIPSYAFFCLQKSSDFEGSMKSNPYTFIPFKKFNFYLDGVPYFKDPLEVASVSKAKDDYFYTESGDFLRQLYKTIGRDLKGDCLINSSNLQLNFIVGVSFGADRSSLSENHLNLQTKSSTYLEIDMGISSGIPSDMVLITYAVYDRQIQIDADRKVKIIE